MKGYWQKADATKDTITSEGWLRTGDVAYLDEEGHIFIVDRIKVGMSGESTIKCSWLMMMKQELIKVKGNQVAPAELEALLLDHPAVADAGVVGVTMYVARQNGGKEANHLQSTEKEKSSPELT